MNPFDARTPPERTRGAQEAGTTDNRPQSSRRPRQVPQIDRVRRLLERGWQCGLVFLEPPDGGAPILRYTGRIHELRKQGYYVDRRPCQHPWHDHRPETQMWEWRIVGHASSGKLPGIER